MNERIQELVDVPGDIWDECVSRLQDWIEDRFEARSRVPVRIRVSQATSAVFYVHIALLLGFLFLMPLCLLAGAPEEDTSSIMMSHHHPEAEKEVTPPGIAVPAQEKSERGPATQGPGPPRGQKAQCSDDDGSDDDALLLRPSLSPQGGSSSESEEYNENKVENKIKNSRRATTTNPGRKSPMNDGVVAVNREKHADDDFFFAARAPVSPVPLLGGGTTDHQTAALSAPRISEPPVQVSDHFSDDGSNSTCPPSTPRRKGFYMLFVAFVAGGLLNLSAFLSVPCF